MDKHKQKKFWVKDLPKEYVEQSSAIINEKVVGVIMLYEKDEDTQPTGDGGDNMSLNTADKKWIVEVVSEIVTKAVTKGIDELENKMNKRFDSIDNRINNLVVKNDLKE